jgi:hypothetical protein
LKLGLRLARAVLTPALTAVVFMQGLELFPLLGGQDLPHGLPSGPTLCSGLSHLFDLRHLVLRQPEQASHLASAALPPSLPLPLALTLILGLRLRLLRALVLLSQGSGLCQTGQGEAQAKSGQHQCFHHILHGRVSNQGLQLL